VTRRKIRPNFAAYSIVRRAVEEGVAYGWGRAHKHTATPTEDAFRVAIEEAVMNALIEVINFGTSR